MTEVNSGMQEAVQHLQAADALIKKSLSWIKQQSTGGKGVSNEKLDAHQMASFDLAWCAAESTGARFAAEYADKVAAAVQRAVARVWSSEWPWPVCAEALQNIHNRLLGATAEFRSQCGRSLTTCRHRPLWPASARRSWMPAISQRWAVQVISAEGAIAEPTCSAMTR
jgi:hypothetical protein